MPVYSTYNQNISKDHLKKFFLAGFKSLKPKNKELISKILNLSTNDFKIDYYQSQRAAFYDYLLFLKKQNPNKNKVILPSYTCCVLVNAVLKADLQVEFIDTKVNSLNYDTQKFQKVVDNQKDQILAILIPSNFGESFDINLVSQFKNQFNLILDSANTLTNFNLDDFKAVLLSFGSNKLLDCVFAGAIITHFNDEFKPSFTKKNLKFEFQSFFKIFNFLLFRKFLNTLVVKAIFKIFSNLNLFPRIISKNEKEFTYNQINYFRTSKFFDGLLNQTLIDFQNSNTKSKLHKLHSSLSTYTLQDFNPDNPTCFYPILVSNPKALFEKLKKQNIFVSLDWTNAQIVPKSAQAENINFNSQSFPNSLDLSQNLLLIPVNNSLDFKAISNTIHIIFDYIHENQVTNHKR